MGPPPHSLLRGGDIGGGQASHPSRPSPEPIIRKVPSTLRCNGTRAHDNVDVENVLICIGKGYLRHFYIDLDAVFVNLFVEKSSTLSSYCRVIVPKYCINKCICKFVNVSRIIKQWTKDINGHWKLVVIYDVRIG